MLSYMRQAFPESCKLDSRSHKMGSFVQLDVTVTYPDEPVIIGIKGGRVGFDTSS